MRTTLYLLAFFVFAGLLGCLCALFPAFMWALCRVLVGIWAVGTILILLVGLLNARRRGTYGR